MAKKLLNWPDEMEEHYKMLSVKKKVPVNTLIVNVLKDYLARLQQAKEPPAKNEGSVSGPVQPKKSKMAEDSF